MKDLNFFSSYSKKADKRKFDSSIILYAILLLIVSSVLIYGIYNFITIKKLNNDIAYKKHELNTKLDNPKVKKVMGKEEDIKLLKEDMEKLKALDKYVQDKDIINEILLEDIRENIPELLFISSLAINQDNIRIEGKSKNKEAIAQFAHNLKIIKKFDQVFVPQIMDNEGHYSFYLDLKLKEGEADGVETESQQT